jgi:hypothetical protein
MNTKKLRISIALTLALLITVGTLAAMTALGGRSPAALARTNSVWTVCPAGPPDCGFDLIQDAVDAAGDGDVIKVATGSYTDVHGRPAPLGYNGPSVITQVIFITKTVTIQGGYDAADFDAPPDPKSNPTTLDARGDGRVIFMSGHISPTLQGLIVTGGDAAALGGSDGATDAGGGVCAISATVTLNDSLIHHNHADGGEGGGVFLTSVETGTIVWNDFRANSARPGEGGGLALRNGTITIRGNAFTENQADSGGGMDLFGSNSLVVDNLVRGNTASSGGGIALGMFGGTLDHNLVISNTAHHDGGGILVFGGDTWRNNVVIDNHAGGSGGALYVMPIGPDLVHTTIARNSSGDGSAIYIADGPFGSAHVRLINSVLVDHGVGISVTAGHSVTIDTVLWHNTPVTVSLAPGAYASVSNELMGDPAFASDGYHLTADSAAIDAGDDAGVAIDIDGQKRPAGQGYDLGADEFWYSIYLPLTANDFQRSEVAERW